MSDTASLELCKELYKLSNWRDTDFKWRGVNETKGVIQNYLLSKQPNTRLGESNIPAYDLSYIIHRLPREFKLRYSKDFWICEFEKSSWASSVSPEDAAINLALDLFKKKVLK